MRQLLKTFEHDLRGGFGRRSHFARGHGTRSILDLGDEGVDVLLGDARRRKVCPAGEVRILIVANLVAEDRLAILQAHDFPRLTQFADFLRQHQRSALIAR